MPYRDLTMKPEARIAWTTALRSGDYHQSTYQLKRPNGYCCMGVWAELNHIPSARDGDCWKYTFPGSRVHAGSLPAVWFTQFFDYPGYDNAKNWVVSDLIAELMELNDQQRLTFPQIADWIDEHLAQQSNNQ